VEIGGKLLTSRAPTVPANQHKARKFTATTSTTRDFFLFFILPFKINLSLVVMMSAVDLWKALHLPRSVTLTPKEKSAEV
jgi:hypothetical protein